MLALTLFIPQYRNLPVNLSALECVWVYMCACCMYCYGASTVSAAFGQPNIKTLTTRLRGKAKFLLVENSDFFCPTQVKQATAKTQVGYHMTGKEKYK